MSFSDFLALTDVFLGFWTANPWLTFNLNGGRRTNILSLLDLFTDMGYSPYCSIHLFFCNLFISRKPINGRDWPARSPPDLNPCDFFLWGYLKSKVYCPKPRTLDDLKNNIGLLQPNMIRRSMTLIIGRAMKCLQASAVEAIFRSRK